MDWAEQRARAIVEPYRGLFRDDAAAHVDGLVNVLAGELRGTEASTKRQALAAGENLMAALHALATH